MQFSSDLFRPFVSLFIFFFSFNTELASCRISQAEIDKHLEMGKQMMSRGLLQDALTHFHAALEGDPNNYLTLYRRATVFLALSRSRAALEDLNKVLELKPDFVQARVQKGQILLKLGRLEESHIELEKVLRKEPNNEEANKLYVQIEPLKKEYKQARLLYSDKDFQNAAALLSKIMESCPWDISIREMRSDCYLALGDSQKAISDLRAATKLISDNTVAYMKLAKLYYGLGEAEDSLNQVRECLKLDPEHKECFPHYKKVKKIAKMISDLQNYVNEQDYKSCIATANKLLKADRSVPMLVFRAEDKLCHCHLKLNENVESIEHCSAALEIKEEPHILCDRAEAYIANDLLDEAQRDYAKAKELDENNSRAQEGLQKVQKLQKQAKKRDYYKILNVKRNANKKEIVKAYRKAAQQWHPDNFQGEEKKMAEKKFIDIAAAKEVLTDPEKRQKYDNGEDPLDPESQQGQGFNPFHHGGFGGFQNFHGGFKFHFN